MTDCFDLTDVSDIPLEIRKDLSVDVFEENILKLFDMVKRDLSIDEITVAYFRKFNEVKTKKQIMGKLYNMSRATKPKIESVSHIKGFYRITK